MRKEVKMIQPEKTGTLIAALRHEHGLTQRQLAERLHISDKTVSKWERGLGCPDISLISALAQALETDPEVLLAGSRTEQTHLRGNLQRTRFYLCPHCGNLITSMGEIAASCCGKRLQALHPAPADEAHSLQIERNDGELFITTEHPMQKEHYFSFLALQMGNQLLLCPQFPEWELQVRLPAPTRRGRLYWHCTQHGLFYRDLRF